MTDPVRVGTSTHTAPAGTPAQLPITLAALLAVLPMLTPELVNSLQLQDGEDAAALEARKEQTRQQCGLITMIANPATVAMLAQQLALTSDHVWRLPPQQALPLLAKCLMQHAGNADQLKALSLALFAGIGAAGKWLA